MKFGEIVKREREAKGWTQKELGDKLFVSNKAISRYENNQSYPDITMLLDLAKVLEIDYQELIEGSDYINRKKTFEQKQRKKKIIWLSVASIVSILFFGLMSYQTYLNNQIQEKGIDFILSKKWESIFMTVTDETMDADASLYLRLTDVQMDRVIDFLDVDHWKKVETIPSSASLEHFYFAFGNDQRNKVENYRVLKDEHDYYVIMMEDENYKYKCNNDITQLYNFYVNLPTRDYEYNHLCDNLMTYPLLDESEVMKLKELTYDFYIDQYVYYHQFEEDGKDYCMIYSQYFDIQSIDYDENQLILNGEKRNFQKIYLLVFEVDSSFQIEKIIINQEIVYDMINHINKLEI